MNTAKGDRMFSKSITAGVGTFLLLLPTIPTHTQHYDSKLADYLNRREKVSGFTGVVLVAQADSVILKQGFGMADYEHLVPNSPKGIFRIASLTKTFTATAVLLEYERGNLSLTDRVSRYIPDCPSLWRTVEIQHLLNHTSGIPDAFGRLQDAPVKETAAELERVLAEINAEPDNRALRTPAGQAYAYSNFNYVLLGYVLEKVSGRYWEDYLIENIFAPLAMNDTRYDDVWAIVPRRVRGYSLKNGSLTNIEYDDHSAYAAGGLRSTVTALWVFMRAYVSGNILAYETLERALQPYQGDYGYGWQVTRSFGRRIYNHTGGIGGFAGHMAYYPAEEISIIVLSNNQRELAHGTACDLAALLFETEHVFLDSQVIELSDKVLAQYEGKYLSKQDGSTVIQISTSGKGLHFASDSVQRTYLPVREDLFVQQEGEDYSLLFLGKTDERTLSIRRCGEELLSAKLLSN